jgi:hypothetical protein
LTTYFLGVPGLVVGVEMLIDFLKAQIKVLRENKS